METLQSELIDERKGQILRSFESHERKDQIGKSLEPTGVEKTGILFLSGGLAPFPLPHNLRIFGFSNVQMTCNYDDIIGRDFPPSPITRNIRRSLIVTRPVAKATQFRNQELEWRRNHSETLEAFANQWVVLEGEQIVAHGEDPVQVINEAKSKGVRTPYIFFVEPKTENVSAIGL
jgi:hypothetical protein